MRRWLLLGKLRSVKNVLFNKYLLLTNIGISSSSSALGDVLQQEYYILRGEAEKWDKIRTNNMGISGLVVGVMGHYWYLHLDKKWPINSLKTVMKKVAIDQILYSPLIIVVFFVTMGLLEKSSFQEVRTEILEKGAHLYVAEWVIWPPAQIINFYFLPTKYRVLYDSTISLVYDVYTSYVKHDLRM